MGCKTQHAKNINSLQPYILKSQQEKWMLLMLVEMLRVKSAGAFQSSFLLCAHGEAAGGGLVTQVGI